MTRSQFRELFKDLVYQLQERFEKKNTEYADEHDVFSSFRRGAKISQLTPERYLWALATKHVDSILRFNGQEPQEVIDEKFGDLALYIMLYWAYAKTQGGLK